MDYTLFPTAWGMFGFVAERGRLVATFLPEAVKRLQARLKNDWPDAVEHPDALPAFRKQVQAYFEGERRTFRVKIDVSRFTSFQQAVLESCRSIPHGQTASYADLARAVGKPGAARAVGSTMARNPLPLVIPCHRVLRSDGSLGGFSGREGISEKKRMLRLERDGQRGVVNLTLPYGRGSERRSTSTRRV